MLGGLDPIIIFSFFKKVPATASLEKIPLATQIVSRFALPPIPIYLSEELTGLYIDSEDKNIDIETKTDTLTISSEVEVNQKAIGSVTTINLVANKNSIGLTLLLAMADQILAKVTSKEYAITYLHNTTTIFNGLLHSFSTSTDADSELIKIKIEIAMGSTQKKSAVNVQPKQGAVNINDAGKVTGGTLPRAASNTGGATGSWTQAPSGGSIPIGGPR